MSILVNQTSINPTTDLFLGNGGGQSTRPVVNTITTVSSTSIEPTATALIAIVPIPEQFNTGDTILYQVALSFQSITLSPGEGGMLAEVSVGWGNEDDEPTGNQGYYPLIITAGQPDFRLTVSFTGVITAPVINVVIRIRNTSGSETLQVGNIQFLRSSYQFVSANSI